MGKMANLRFLAGEWLVSCSSWADEGGADMRDQKFASRIASNSWSEIRVIKKIRGQKFV